MSWNEEVYQHFYKRLSKHVPSIVEVSRKELNEVGMDGWPIGYWSRQAMTSMQEVEARIRMFIEGILNKDELIEFMQREELPPYLMAEIFEWLEEHNGPLSSFFVE